MKEVVDYWLNKYDWPKQEKLLNTYPQYMTNIEGIDVHFIHVKPSIPAGMYIKCLFLLPEIVKFTLRHNRTTYTI